MRSDPENKRVLRNWCTTEQTLRPRPAGLNGATEILDVLGLIVPNLRTRKVAVLGRV
jgi:hypothetical protein